MRNHIAVTENYEFVVLTGNLVPILVVGLLWMWEVYRPLNEYFFQRLPAWRYWVLPFVLLAFWSPISAELNPDFNPFTVTHIFLWSDVLSHNTTHTSHFDPDLSEG